MLKNHSPADCGAPASGAAVAVAQDVTIGYLPQQMEIFRLSDRCRRESGKAFAAIDPICTGSSTISTNSSHRARTTSQPNTV